MAILHSSGPRLDFGILSQSQECSMERVTFCYKSAPRNKNHKIDRSNPAITSKFCRFGGQVESNIADQKQHAQYQSCRGKCAMHFDVFVLDCNKRTDEAEKSRAVEDCVQLRQNIERCLDFIRKIFHRWDEK